MAKKKINIWFDMDGTIADLYGHDDWLKRLRKEDQSLFLELTPMVNIKDFEAQLQSLEEFYSIIDVDFTFGIITWTPMDANWQYHKECERAKMEWIMNIELGDILPRFNAIPYGTPKQYALGKGTKEYNILVDDNKEVIKQWETKTLRKGVLVKNSKDKQQNLDDMMRELSNRVYDIIHQ